ncbi:MAG: DUF6249 domain-containing protein [Bacteroidales bacterium]|jgi:hypothetical protein|nr:DUF6249 domain-containing protein [Bacteroidales bacterium]
MRKLKISTFLIAFLVTTIVSAQSKSDEALISIKDEYKEAFSRIDSTKIPEVIANIESKRADTEQKKAFWNSTSSIEVVIPFIMIILIVVSVQYFRYKRKKDLYLLITKIIESGKEVPIDLLKEPKKNKNELKRGLVFSSLGIAIITGGFIIDKHFFVFGLIPLLLGIAYIIFHLLDKSKDDN